MTNDVIPFRDFTPVSRLFSEFERAFEEEFFKDPLFSISSKRQYPKINVSESNTDYAVEVAIPGYNKEDVTVEFKDNNLVISAEKSSTIDVEDKNYIHKEISSRKFSRVVPLTEPVDEKKIKGSYENGILTIELPKKTVKKEKSVKVKID